MEALLTSCGVLLTSPTQPPHGVFFSYTAEAANTARPQDSRADEHVLPTPSTPTARNKGGQVNIIGYVFIFNSTRFMHMQITDGVGFLGRLPGRFFRV